MIWGKLNMKLYVMTVGSGIIYWLVDKGVFCKDRCVYVCANVYKRM